jgi:hypothetical protein
LRFVETGNTAFIATKTISSKLMAHLYAPGRCSDSLWDDYHFYWDSARTRLSLKEPLPGVSTPLQYIRRNARDYYYWHYIDTSVFCPAQPNRILGFLNDTMVNFAAFPFGEGHFLFHTTPLAFTNYQLLQPEVRAYIEGVLAHLPEGPVYWDTHSQISEDVGRRRNSQDGMGRDLPKDHPLKYILAQPALAWAWYLLLALALLWIIFRGKRRQRIQPVLTGHENTSVPLRICIFAAAITGVRRKLRCGCLPVGFGNATMWHCCSTNGAFRAPMMLFSSG